MEQRPRRRSDRVDWNGVVNIYPPCDPKSKKPNHTSLTQEDFDIDKFIGKWWVTHSTLPMWKNKKDVSISYKIIQAAPLKLNDLVEYRSEKASSSSAPSAVHGVSSLRTRPQQLHEHGAYFQWRGAGLLKPLTSKWQVIGYNHDKGWAVTYFEATWFTPAGMDIYCRNKDGLGDDFENVIIKEVQKLEGKAGELAKNFFQLSRGH